MRTDARNVRLAGDETATRKPPVRVRITKQYIDKLATKLPPPGKRRYIFDDAGAHGLQLQITSTGAMTWFVYRRVNNSPARVRIGTVDDFPPDAARRKAKEINEHIAAGEDPNDAKRAIRGAKKFHELFTRYLDDHAKPHKRTWREDEQKFTTYLSRLKNKPLTEIDYSTVAALHRSIGERGARGAANRVLALLSSVFRHAIRIGWAKENPCRNVQRYPEQSRKRRLHDDEIIKFWSALQAEDNQTFRDFFTILFLTGARRGNVMRMRWCDVNMDRGTWEIPASEFKNGEATTLRLAPPAVEVLKARLAGARGSEYVFPGRGNVGHLASIYGAWDRLRERVGLADIRPHDLRRTFATVALRGGATIAQVGRALGHRHQASTAPYARLVADDVQAAVDATAAAIAPPAAPRDRT